MRRLTRQSRRLKFVITSVCAFLVALPTARMTASGEAISGYQITDLGTLHSVAMRPAAVNASGAVAGYAFLPGDDFYTRAFVYKDGILNVLQTFGGNYGGACCINASG